MRNLNKSKTSVMVKEYKDPLPKHLVDVSVDDIFAETRLGIGLMGIAFDWIGRQLRRSWPESKMQKALFEDIYVASFEKVCRKRQANELTATTPKELMAYIRKVFASKAANAFKVPRHLQVGETKDDSSPPLEGDPDPEQICIILDKIIVREKVLTRTELVFWNEYKQKPFKKDKRKIMQALGLTSNSYDQTKFRVLGKIQAHSSLKIENLVELLGRA